MRAEEQARYERRIFRSFVAAASLHVAEKSIRSRRPPHADISCRTREGSRLAFELVQIVDQGMAQDVRSQITLQESLRHSCDTLARAQRVNLRKHLRDALVAVWFRERASRKVRDASIPSIVAELEQIDASIEGDVPLSGKATLHGVVKRLRISRGDFIGPCFYVSAGGSFAVTVHGPRL
jgi:hypothetical protein